METEQEEGGKGLGNDLTGPDVSNIGLSAEKSSGPKTRNRAITMLRIGIHGRTPKCFGCKEGTYDHTQECRDRFNMLLDTCEPLSKDKSLSSRAHDRGVSGEKAAEVPINPLPARSAEREREEEGDEGSEGYAPTSPRSSVVSRFLDEVFPELDLEGSENIPKSGSPRALIASGNKLSELVETVEKGPSVVASMFFEAIELGGQKKCLCQPDLQTL